MYYYIGTVQSTVATRLVCADKCIVQQEETSWKVFPTSEASAGLTIHRHNKLTKPKLFCLKTNGRKGEKKEAVAK